MLRLLIFLLLAASASAQVPVIHNYRSDGPGRQRMRMPDNSLQFIPAYYNLNLFQTVSPGDTILMGGEYMYIYFDGIRGTKEKPVIIKRHPDSLIQIGKRNNTAVAYGMVVTNSFHFKLVGFNSQDCEIYKPSDTLNQGFNFGTSHNFEASGFTIRFCNAGIYARPNNGGRRANIVLKDFVIIDQRETNTNPRGTAEGVYIGSTSLLDTSITYYDSILLENIHVYDGDGDGIQVAMARNLIVRNCSVTNWARTDIPGQRVAYVFGGSTQGILENCTATAGPAGKGAYWHLFGSGLSIGRNLTFTGAGTSPGQAGIYVDEKSTLAEPKILRIENSVISGTNTSGIQNVNSPSIQLCNVTFSGIGTTNTQGNNFGTYSNCNVPPPPIQPTKPNRRVLRPGKPIRLRAIN